MWRQVLRKSPWGKLGGLPGGGKAEGQEPKEGMRCLLGHGMAVGRWVGETDDPERSTGSVERELGGRAGRLLVSGCPLTAQSRKQTQGGLGGAQGPRASLGHSAPYPSFFSTRDPPTVPNTHPLHLSKWQPSF